MNFIDSGALMIQPQIIKNFSEINKTVGIDEATLILLDIDNYNKSLALCQQLF